MAKPAFYIEGIPVYQVFMKESFSNYPAKPMDPKYFTVHETENFDKGADAEMHSRYLQNQAWGRQASWHFTVDDEKIYQHAPINRTCWHAGDGSGPGNTESIGIEHCEDEGSDFEKTVKNGQVLVRYLSKQTGNPLSNTFPHNKWSGKNCPNNILPYWDKYKASLGAKSAAEPVKVPKPKKPRNNTNNSIVDYLSSIGANSSFANRKKLAVQYGVKNYKGTASQNLELLHKMREGDMPSRKEEPSSGYKGNSVVDYLNSIGENSSFTNRKKLAAKYGIGNYKGTASQNSQLLNKMRGGAKPAVKPKPAVKKGNQTTTSVVDYLKSIGADSSFSNRSKLAAKHGIKSYRGTAAQNSQLLKKLRG